jgi:hypothetical protein
MKLIKYLLYLDSILKIISQNACGDCIKNLKMGLTDNCDSDCSNEVTHTSDCLDYTRCLYDYNLHKIENICVCQKTSCIYEYVCPNVEVLQFDNKLDGYTTFEISLEVKNINSNIYAIYGDNEDHMIIPEAYQTSNNIGSNIGGINQLLLNYFPNSEFDSWLTIGVTDGNSLGTVNTIGIDFSNWTLDNGLNINDGAIFLNDPFTQISHKKYIIAHLTLRNNKQHIMKVNVNGHIDINNVNTESFREKNIIFDIPYIYNTPI